MQQQLLQACAVRTGTAANCSCSCCRPPPPPRSSPPGRRVRKGTAGPDPGCSAWSAVWWRAPGKGSRPASPLSPPTTTPWPRPESRPGESVRRKTTFQIGAAQCGQIRVQCSQSVMPSATTRFFCKVQNVHLFHLFVKPRFGIPQKPPKPTNGYLAKNLHCFVIQ